MIAHKKKKKTISKKVVIKKIKKVSKISKKKTKKRAVGKKVAKIKKPKKTTLRKKLLGVRLKRALQNPLIEPSSSYWKSKATFNPTAFYHDNKIHILYRAIGVSDNSVLGYAGSGDGITISENFPVPVYFHFMQRRKDGSLPLISYSSGGGWGGGCEDPRATKIGDKVYILYTAFDGWGSVRVAISSINLNDFIANRWVWKEPVLISPPGEMHKNWVLFPEKINGKYAIMHSISPNILIDYFDSLDELDGKKFIHSTHSKNAKWDKGEKLVRGIGPSPLKTKYGWLVFYHAMQKSETHRYKLWAMILDAKDPTKVLYNSNKPILEPNEWYENEGFKSGVVYSCGAVIKDGELFVYYGGADKVSCVATANLDTFLEELVHSNSSTLKGGRIKK